MACVGTGSTCLVQRFAREPKVDPQAAAADDVQDRCVHRHGLLGTLLWSAAGSRSDVRCRTGGRKFPSAAGRL